MVMNLLITNWNYMELKKQVSKKIFIKTFGCQMNEYDSKRIKDIIKVLVTRSLQIKVM